MCSLGGACERPDAPEESTLARGLSASVWALVALLASAVGATATATDQTESIRFQLSRNATGGAAVKDALAGTQAWCDEFADALSRDGRPMVIQAEIARGANTIVQGMGDGTVDAAYVSAVEFVRMQERIDVRAIATAVNSDGIPHETGALIVGAAVEAESISDLAGRSFADQGALSSVGYLYPQSLLASAGLPALENHFGTLIDVQSQRSALYSVILGKAEATAVSSFAVDLVTELNPALAKRFRVLHRSQPMPLCVLVVRDSLDEDLIARFETFIAAQQEGLSPRLQSVLQFMKVAGLRRPKKDEFDYVRELVRMVDQRTHRVLDPICGQRLTEDRVEHRAEVGDTSVAFCGDTCHETFQRHRRPFGDDGRGRVLVIGIVPQTRGDLDPRDLLAGIAQQFSDVAPSLGLEFAAELLPSHEVARVRLLEGSVDLVRVSGPGYVRLQTETGLVPLARPAGGSETFHAVLLTGVDSDVEDVLGLRGLTVALEDHDSSEMDIFLNALVSGLGEERPEDFLGGVMRCPTEASALRAVVFGNADAAAVSTSTLDVLEELQPALGKRLKRLEVSQALSHGPICVRRDLDTDVVEALREYLVNMHETTRGHAALTFFRLRRMVPATDADYDGVRALLRKVAKR